MEAGNHTTQEVIMHFMSPSGLARSTMRALQLDASQHTARLTLICALLSLCGLIGCVSQELMEGDWERAGDSESDGGDDQVVEVSAPHDHEATEFGTAQSALVAGGVLPTVFPSDDTVIGSYRHGTYVESIRRTHLGVDVLESPVAGTDEPVHSMAAGVVVDVVSSLSDPNFGSLGYMALIRHRKIGDGGADLYSIYLHLTAAPQVRVGAPVSKGQQIGLMGRTGHANNIYHTHFEIRYFSSRLSTFWAPGNIYGPVDCDLRNAASPPESTDGDSCDAADYTYFVDNWEDPQTFVVPPPPAPSGLSATDGNYTDRVRLNWTGVVRDGVSYDVYRSTSSSSYGTRIASGRTSTTYDDTSAAAGTTYHYRVRSISSDGSSGYSASNAGYRAGRAVSVPSTPTGVRASDGAYTDRVRVTYYAVAGATRYYIYRATSTTGSYTRLGYCTSTACSDTSATPGTTYYYKVRAYNSAGYSGYSAYNSGYRAR